MEITPDDMDWLTDLAATLQYYVKRYYNMKEKIAQVLEDEDLLEDDPEATIYASPRAKPLLVALSRIGEMIDERLQKAREELARRNLQAPNFVAALEQEMRECKEYIQFIYHPTH